MCTNTDGIIFKKFRLFMKEISDRYSGVIEDLEDFIELIICKSPFKMITIAPSIY